MSIPTISAGLLVVGGLINALPPVSQQLSRLSGGKPVLQIAIGIISTAVGLILVTDIL